jgi:hypothetical protein
MEILMIFIILISQSGWGPEIVAVYRDSLQSPGDMHYTQIAVNGDTVHIVWYGTPPPGGASSQEIFYTRSCNGGLTFEAPRIISQIDSFESIFPSICVNGYSVHVGWWDDNSSFKYRRSLNGGETWEPIRTLIPEEKSGRGVIGNKGDTIVIVSPGSSYYWNKFWFRKSLDNGLSWSDPILIDRWIGGLPKVGISPPFISLVTVEADPNSGYAEIYYIRSPDLGNTWERDTMISEPWNDSALRPDLYIDGSKLYVTWFDYKYTTHAWTGDIFLRISYDNGTTWEAIRETISTSHLATTSAVCAFTNQIHIVWVEEIYGSSELYYRYGTKVGNGYKWSKIDRLTFANGVSDYPDITYSNGKLHLVWIDWRREAPGIYYRYRSIVNCEEKINLNYNFYISSILIKDDLISKLKGKNIKIFNLCGGAQDINFRKVKGVYFIFLEKNYKIKVIKVR